MSQTPLGDPARISREELLRHLAVDPAVGLSAREAELRRDRMQEKPLFATTDKPFLQCLLSVLREPVLWILLSVSLIALFFDRVSLGLVCFILAGGHTLLCAFLLRRAERVDATMQKAYDAPSPRVLRSGRICRIGADCVVPGDILILRPGDLVPADCRLLVAENFVVSERELDATDPKPPVSLPMKDADYMPPADSGDFRVSPPHMAYAGAVVETGCARAVVVAVGSGTHLGGLLGSIRPSHGIRVSETRKTVARLSTWVSIILAIAIIPIVTVGILTLRDRYELLDIFLSAVSLAALGLCEHTVARYAVLTASLRRDAATLRDTDNTADIRSDADAERLARMTDLLLLGTAALHDGRPYPVGMWTFRHGSATLSHCNAPGVHVDAGQAVELLFLWHRGRAALPADLGGKRALESTVEDMLPALCEWAETDTDGLLVRYTDIQSIRGGVSATVNSSEGNYRLSVRVSESLPEGHGEMDVHRQKARDDGYSTLWIILSDNRESEERILAMLIYAPRTSEKTVGWIKSMESAGIRVAALLPQVGGANTRILTACGLTDRYPAVLPTSSLRNIAAIMDEGVRAFEGCSDLEISTCIRDLQEEGRVVGVLSVNAGDSPHLNAADVAITCSPSLYRHAESDFFRPTEDGDTIPDGEANSRRADDLCRRRADVIVRRTRPTGGGLGGVRTALLAADRMHTILSAVSGYLFLSTALRLVAVLVSAVLGLLPIPAPLLLFSGLALDAVVLFSLRHIPPDTVPSRRRAMTDGMETPWLTVKMELICLSVTAVLPWVVALIARFAGAGIEKGMEGYALLCLVAAQTVLYVTLRPRRDHAGRQRTDRTYAVMLLLLILVYVGALAAALGMGLHPLYALLVPPIPALLYIVAVLVIGKLTGRKQN